jgi:integrase
MTPLRLKYIHEYLDRHGRLRRYVRRRGCRRVPLPGLPGSPEFMEAYQAALSEAPRPNYAHHAIGTMGWLAVEFCRSTEFSNLKPSSKGTYRSILDKLRHAHGHRLARDLQLPKARKLIEDIGISHPAMANLTRAVFRRLMEYGIALGLRHDNPFDKVPTYRLGTHHTWTDNEIEAYEKRWLLGTRERLALALLLYTGQRVGDAVRMRRSDIKNGMIHVLQQKTAKDEDDYLLIPIHPALQRAMRAWRTDSMYVLTDAKGRPITRQSLTRLIRVAASAAGLPSQCVAHGLRKAALRRLAEHGSTTKEIAAVSGHRSLKEIERYTQRADQARLSRAALKRIPDRKKHEQRTRRG